MSVRLTKKSVVSAPSPVGEDAVLRAAVVGAHRAHAADQHRHLRTRQAQKLRAVEHQLLRADGVVLLQPVAEPVGDRLEHREAVGIGHLVGRVAAARGERHVDVEARGLRRLLDAHVAGQHDHVGNRRAGARRDAVPAPPARRPGAPARCLPSPSAAQGGCVRHWPRRAGPTGGRSARCPMRWRPCRRPKGPRPRSSP
jgi:hypothetical protein